jgi:hypothetical protein
LPYDRPNSCKQGVVVRAANPTIAFKHQPADESAFCVLGNFMQQSCK